jgi:hypothetical protein
MVAYQPLAAGMAATLILAAPLLASTIRVPADQPTLQQGIGAAAVGDTVLVAPGTYSGPNNQNLDFLGKDLVLRSQSGAQVTVIQSSGGGRGFNLHLGETADAIIDGFTVTGGSVSGDPGDTGAAFAVSLTADAAASERIASFGSARAQRRLEKCQSTSPWNSALWF